MKKATCFFNKALAIGQQKPSHSEHHTKTAPSKEAAHKLIPVYRRMADEDLLMRLAFEGSQNSNECLNALVWSRCPKTMFMGLRRLCGGVARAVANFNQGTSELMSVMGKLQIDIVSTTRAILFAKITRRLKKAKKNSTAASKEKRKEVAQRR